MYYKNKFFSDVPIALKNINQEIIQLKDKKVTRIFFKANNAHKINAISFSVNNQFFLRTAKLVVKRKRKIKKRIKVYEKVLSSFQG